jgi:cell division protein FtsQ
MDRSLAARLTRPFATPPTRRASASSRARGASAGSPSTARLGRLARPLTAGLASLWRHRRARIALLCLVLSLPLMAGGFVLLRHSSLVAVERVHVSGVHGPESAAIETALSVAARHMSTLDVRTGALRAAVAPFRVVRAISVHAEIPHGLRIEVVEQLPVAALQVGSGRTAVAADGVVLGPALLSSGLPSVGGFRLPGPGQQVHDAGLLGYVTVLGAAPGPLGRLVARVYSGPEGLTVAMRSGLLAYFGDASRPHAKWLSLARVLADHSSLGASYVDVRLPARPAAGWASGTGQASGSGGPASAAEGTSQSESAVAALAAGLSKETPGAASTGPQGASGSSSESGESPSEAASGSAGAASPESQSSTGAEASPGTNAAGG